MNFLYSFINSVTRNFFKSPDEACVPSEIEASDAISRKRRRDDIDDDLIEIEDFPPKRSLLLREGSNILRDSNMNNYNNVDVPKPSDTQTYGNFLLSSMPKRFGSDIFHKPADNWTTPVVDDDVITLSPSQFKNRFKAPKHVRSPNKRSKSSPSVQQTHNGSMMMSIDLTSPSENTRPKTSMIASRGIFGTPRLSPKSQLFRPKERGFDEYQRLLCSVLSEDSKVVMKQSCPPRIRETVDLTESVMQFMKKFTNEDTIDLTDNHTTPQKKSSQMFERKGLPPLAVKPNFINIADDDVEELSRYGQKPSTPRPVVPRVNSFEDNLKNNKYTKPTFVQMKNEYYQKFLERMKTEQQQCALKVECDRQINSAKIDELINQRLFDHLKITDSILIEEEEEEEEVIQTVKPELTKEMLAKIYHAWNERLSPREVLVSKFKLDVTRTDFMTLKNLNWLNDAVINFYMELIVERGGSAPAYPEVYAFSTFFFPTLTKGYDRVRRYTRKVDLFSKDIILVPIHLAVHWCMAKIDIKNKKIVYYDSMKASNQKALDILLDYLVQEHRDKKKEELDVTDWETVNDKDIPCQRNGSDCGVFACTFGEYSSRKSRFNFSQEDMHYMRQKMVYEIVTGRLLL